MINNRFGTKVVDNPLVNSPFFVKEEEQSEVTPPNDGFLLQENGFFLLQENGARILLEV